MLDSALDASAAPPVCAIIVTFHPDAGFAGRLRALRPQVDAAVIVDNGSTDAELAWLRDADAGEPLTLIRHRANLGVARALNAGVEHARAAGFRWALLLDQDTEPDADMVRELLAALTCCGNEVPVAAVGSRFRDPTGQSLEARRMPARGERWQEVESAITSGSLLSLDAHAAVGPFRDEFFIDYVDTEFCFRARAAGYRIIESSRPLMAHSVGAPTAHRLFGSTTWTSNHSPDRRYYIARNNTVMLREYGSRGRSPWQWKSLVRCWRLCKRIALYEDEKLEKIAAVAQGWWHGMRGRLGPRHLTEPTD